MAILTEIAKKGESLPPNALNIDRKKSFFRQWSKIIEKDPF